jgi:hypothetical protein
MFGAAERRPGGDRGQAENRSLRRDGGLVQSEEPRIPPLVGHDAILKFNQDFLKLPQLAMTGESETIRFSDDGTMAYDTGKCSVSFADAKAHHEGRREIPERDEAGPREVEGRGRRIQQQSGTAKMREQREQRVSLD